MKILGRRSAGVLVPLFSIRTGSEWGVGEYPDLARFAAWAKGAGFSLVMTLPLLEPSPGQDSPYSSCSFFALDPLYLRLEHVPEFAALGGMASLTPDERALLELVQESPRVRHADVRRLKDHVPWSSAARPRGKAAEAAGTEAPAAGTRSPGEDVTALALGGRKRLEP